MTNAGWVILLDWETTQLNSLVRNVQLPAFEVGLLQILAGLGASIPTISQLGHLGKPFAQPAHG